MTGTGETEAYQVWLTGIHPEDRERVEEELRLAVSGEKEYDTEFLLLDSFLGDFAAQMKTLRQRFTESDRTGARIEAHALKGSSATVSAVSLSAVALEMESAAAAGELERFGRLLPRLEEEFERFERGLTLAGWR